MESRKPETSFHSLQDRITALSRRDLQLWSLSALVAVVLAAGIFAVFLPKFWDSWTRQTGHYFVPLFFGLIVLVVLFNIYMVQQRREVESMRQQLIAELTYSQRMQNLTMVDPLTQAFNRRYLDHVLPKEVHRANRHRSALSFLLVDIEGFHNLNARLGHLEGDHALVETAKLLQQVFGSHETVLRFSGGQFLVILPDCNEQDAENLMSQVKEKLKTWNDSGKSKYSLQFSYGISAYVLDSDIKDALHVAEENLHQQKKDLSDGLAYGRSLKLDCLLVSRDESLVSLIRPILESMGINVEVLDDGSTVLQRAVGRRVDGMVIDCGLDDGPDVFEVLRESPLGRSVTFIGVRGPGQPVLEGAKFTLEKPLYRSMCARTLRVARALMLAGKQRYYRHPIEAVVALSTKEGLHERCAATDISEGGIALRWTQALPVGSSCFARFTLPEGANEITARGEIAWSDTDGRAGFRFLDLPQKSRAELDKWLAANLSQVEEA
jgi:diguanylate cyclase (GGDEF)-like protein